MGMIEKVTSAINIKEDIRDAITAKGVDMATVTFGGFAEKIGEIPSGIDPSTATAARGDVRQGKTFFAGDDNIKSGNMSDVTISQSSTATLIRGPGFFPYYETNITYIDSYDADATEDDVRWGKTFYAYGKNRRTGRAHHLGIPPIPSTFTSLNLNQDYTASGDGWIRYTIRYNWGMGQNSYLDVGTRSYSFANVQGEDMDIGSLTMTGIAPVYAGEVFKLTAQGSTSASSVLEVAYL